jgi:uncharacterized membrane protein (DUF106 family)
MKPTTAQIEARLGPGFRQEYREALHFQDETELQRMNGEWNAVADDQYEMEEQALVGGES